MGRPKGTIPINKENAEELLRYFGLTKKDLGDMTGYTRSSISIAINNGMMDRSMIDRIGESLDVHPDYLKGNAERIDDIPWITDDIKASYLRSHRVDSRGYIIPHYSEYQSDRDFAQIIQQSRDAGKALDQYLYLAGAVGIPDLEKTPVQTIKYTKDHLDQNLAYYHEEIQKTVLRVYYSIQNKDEQYQKFMSSIIRLEDM